MNLQTFHILAIHTGTQKRRQFPNQQQKTLLKATFIVQFSPNKSTYKELALQTGLTERQVSQWFSHARHNTRKGAKLQMRFICECLIEAQYGYVCK